MCKQEHKETVVSYSQRIENCLVRLTNSLDPNLKSEERSANVKLLRSQALTIFLMGLNRDLNIVVKSQRPNTLEDAISLAQAEEKEQLARREIERHSNTSYFKPSNSHYSRPPHYNINKAQTYNFNSRPLQHKTFSSHPISFNSNPKPNFNFQSPSQVPPKQCRYCKNLGHTIQECRKRQYNNSMRNQNRSPYKPHQQTTSTQDNSNSTKTNYQGIQRASTKNVPKNV